MDALAAESKAKRKPKEKKVKEILYWTDAKEKFYPNHPNVTYSPKELKIYNSILEKIDKETSVTARQFVYWVFENWDDLEFKYPFPRIKEFNYGYMKALDKFLTIQTKYNYNTKSGLPSLRVRK